MQDVKNRNFAAKIQIVDLKLNRPLLLLVLVWEVTR